MSNDHPSQANTRPDIRAILQGSRIPVGAWVSPPPAGIGTAGNPNFITGHSYHLAKNAGITMLYGLYENIENRREDAENALVCAAGNDLHYLACSHGIAMGQSMAEIQHNISRFGVEAPSYLGVLAFDEPSESQFDQLSALCSHYRSLHPDKLFYVNLLPYCAKITQIQLHKSDESGQATTPDEYRHYLESYIQKVSPRVLSFDNYPCVGPFPAVANHYFLNLSMVCAAARRHGIPAWCFIQTCSWNPNVRVPEEAEILWQVNTALAYGIRGIQYFTFWQPLADGTWQGGMISPTGEKLPQYDYVCHANRQIRLCQEQLTHAAFKGLLVYGDSPAPIPGEDLLTGFPPVSQIDSDIPLLIGCYQQGNTRSLYIVNNSLEKAGSSTVTFQSKTRGQFLHLDGCGAFHSNQLTVSLNPGAAAFLQLC